MRAVCSAGRGGFLVYPAAATSPRPARSWHAVLAGPVKLPPPTLVAPPKSRTCATTPATSHPTRRPCLWPHSHCCSARQVTCILAVAPIYALSHAWGWLLRLQGVLTWSQGKASVSVTALTWWLAPAIAAVITTVLFLYWWATLVSGGPGRGVQRARLVDWAAAITAGLALLMLAAPLLIAWLDHSTGALGTMARFIGLGGSGGWSPAALAGLVTAVVAVARTSQKQLARLSLPAAGVGSSGGTVMKLAAWGRGNLMAWLGSLMIIAAGAFATLLWIGNAARAGYSPPQPAGLGRSPRAWWHN
jgi:hypothetical protein